MLRTPSIPHYIYDSAGKPAGVEGILRDMTGRRQAEEMNRQYSRDLVKLLSISHEITITADLKSLYRTFISVSKDLLSLDFSSLLLLSEDKTRKPSPRSGLCMESCPSAHIAKRSVMIRAHGRRWKPI